MINIILPQLLPGFVYFHVILAGLNFHVIYLSSHDLYLIYFSLICVILTQFVWARFAYFHVTLTHNLLIFTCNS